MKDNPTLKEEAKGNHNADRLAVGAKYCFYNNNHLKLAKILPEREEKYTKLLKHIHNIVVRVHLASQHVRTTPAYKQDNPTTTVPTWVLHQ